MRNIISPLLIAACLSIGCNHVHKKLRERIINCDSAAINYYFKGDGIMDTVVMVKIIKDKNTLDLLSSMNTEDVTKEKINCGTDGSIHFFKSDMVKMDIFFRMN